MANPNTLTGSKLSPKSIKQPQESSTKSIDSLTSKFGFTTPLKSTNDSNEVTEPGRDLDVSFLKDSQLFCQHQETSSKQNPKTPKEITDLKDSYYIKNADVPYKLEPSNVTLRSESLTSHIEESKRPADDNNFKSSKKLNYDENWQVKSLTTPNSHSFSNINFKSLHTSTYHDRPNFPDRNEDSNQNFKKTMGLTKSATCSFSCTSENHHEAKDLLTKFKLDGNNGINADKQVETVGKKSSVKEGIIDGQVAFNKDEPKILAFRLRASKEQQFLQNVYSLGVWLSSELVQEWCADKKLGHTSEEYTLILQELKGLLSNYEELSKQSDEKIVLQSTIMRPFVNTTNSLFKETN